MPFTFSEEHIVQRRMLGYTVFRQIIPPALVRDLRRACEPVYDIARKNAGPRAMRLTGTTRNGLDPRAFTDFVQLPALNDALKKLFTPEHTAGEIEGMAILIETADIPITQAWHRDAREEDLLEERWPEFRRVVYDPNFINQYNCPLYEDHALWFVPGSHLRPDLPSEIAACKSKILVGDHFTEEEREYLGVRYCKEMPGATCLSMDAGDFAIYHPCAWHLGSVLPYRKRATLHNIPIAPEVKAWNAQWHGWQAEKKQKAGKG
ncbi:MAG: hypothetical protein NTW19_11590 [Planctomycetota bacterium]|nr:hypothetical protein [Planctomycetota bacterium]